MQFIRSKQQVITCPQCDNVIRNDAEVCNICGKRLKGASGKGSPSKQASQKAALQQAQPIQQVQHTRQPIPPLAPASQVQPAPPLPPSLTPPLASQSLASEEVVDDEEIDEAYEEVEYEEEVDEACDIEDMREENDGVDGNIRVPPALPEILDHLHYLSNQTGQIEQYFPADLSEKAQKLDLWKKQLQRALACATLLERSQFQQVESQQILRLRHHLAETARALDFTREYTIKIIGHAGAGKSTLLAAMLGLDIFPRLAGGAVTGVRTRIRLCNEQEPEELRIQFLTRGAFEELLRQTQQHIQHAATPQQREALVNELSILLKAGETFAERYLKNEQPYVEILPRQRWKKEGSRYIEEPARGSQESRLIRLIDYVEYTVHAITPALLPPGSILVDLPGGSAGQLRHDAILREELHEVDAIILMIGNNRFGDDDRTQRIFEQVRRRVTQQQAPDVAARMVFLAVTHWDEITSAASAEKALGSLHPLLHDLPIGYSNYHHHGPDHDLFFYPIRGLDALLATLGKSGQKLDGERSQEGRDYAGRVLSVYPELLKIDSTLPPTASAQDFQEVSVKQHEAMLTFSGLSELMHDLQLFLTSNRYEVQLRQAETQLAMALQQLEDLSWEALNSYGIHSRDLQELQQEMLLRKNKRGAARFEQLQKRTSEMHSAWNDALKQFDAAISSENNPFHRTLELAHQRAARRIRTQITQGQFDHFIQVSNGSPAISPAMEIGHRWIDIDGWGLIRELRQSFTSALERELNEPARTLAEAFLIPIAHKEEVDGALDINQIALGESGGELDEIHKAYNKLKRGIREKARDVCLYVTLSELLNEEKYAPTKDDPAVNALYRLAAVHVKPEEQAQQARQAMGPILDVICSQLAHSTERRIIHLFRYELDKLESRQVYESDRLDLQPGRVPGQFTELVNYLYSLLTERVLTSETLRQQLDEIQTRREADVDYWVELLHDTEELRIARRQS